MNKMSYGERVYYLRWARHWSQAELAKRADLAQTTVSRIETEDYKAGDYPHVVSIAHAIEISLDTLVDGSDIAIKMAARRLAATAISFPDPQTG